MSAEEIWRQMIKSKRAKFYGMIRICNSTPIEFRGVGLGDFIFLLVQLNNTFFWLDQTIEIEIQGKIVLVKDIK